MFLHPQVWQELRRVPVTCQCCNGKFQEVPALLVLLRPRRHSEECDINQTLQFQRAVPLAFLANMHDGWWGCHRCHGKADSVPLPPL